MDLFPPEHEAAFDGRDETIVKVVDGNVNLKLKLILNKYQKAAIDVALDKETLLQKDIVTAKQKCSLVEFRIRTIRDTKNQLVVLDDFQKNENAIKLLQKPRTMTNTPAELGKSEKEKEPQKKPNELGLPKEDVTKKLEEKANSSKSETRSGTGAGGREKSPKQVESAVEGTKKKFKGDNVYWYNDQSVSNRLGSPQNTDDGISKQLIPTSNAPGRVRETRRISLSGHEVTVLQADPDVAWVVSETSVEEQEETFAFLAATLMTKSYWLKGHSSNGCRWLLLTLLTLAFCEYAYVLDLLGLSKHVFVVFIENFPAVYKFVLLQHLFISFLEQLWPGIFVEYSTAAYKSIALSLQFSLNYCFLRCQLVSTSKHSFGLIAPCIMQMVYAMCALFYQSPGKFILERFLDKTCIICSPFASMLVVYANSISMYEPGVFMVVLSLLIYILGFFVWISTKLERNLAVTYMLKVYKINSHKHLIAPKIIRCRHPTYLGICLMVFAWSIMCDTAICFFVPVVISLYLYFRAQRFDKVLQQHNPEAWKKYSEHITQRLLPFKLA